MTALPLAALDVIDAEIRRSILALANPERDGSVESHCQSITTLYEARAIAEEYIVRSRSSLETL